jgi:hypothetical protein
LEVDWPGQVRAEIISQNLLKCRSARDGIFSFD